MRIDTTWPSAFPKIPKIALDFQRREMVYYSRSVERRCRLLRSRCWFFYILPGAQWPGTGGTRKAESAKGGWQHPPAYATAYDASRRNRQFQDRKRSTKVALCGSFHVACLLFMFSVGHLAMPFLKCENVRHATFFFAPHRGESRLAEAR